MKNLILSFVIFFVSLSALHAAPKPEGYETNGGDAICAEFLEIFDGIANTLKKSVLSLEESAILSAMISKRAVVDLSSVPDLVLNGESKDAINQPNLEIPKIILSQRSWPRLSFAQKKLLVLHEMLPVAGYADRDFVLSIKLMNIVNALPALTPQRIENIQRAFKNCDEDYLSTLNPASLKGLGQINLPSMTFDSIYGQCPLAFEILSSVSWDYNKCDSKKRTTLALAQSQKDDLKIWLYFDPEQAILARQSIENLDLIIKTIISHGGTKTCSGFYP